MTSYHGRISLPKSERFILPDNVKKSVKTLSFPAIDVPAKEILNARILLPVDGSWIVRYFVMQRKYWKGISECNREDIETRFIIADIDTPLENTIIRRGMLQDINT
jgi:hypothetical protein